MTKDTLDSALQSTPLSVAETQTQRLESGEKRKHENHRVSQWAQGWAEYFRYNVEEPSPAPASSLSQTLIADSLDSALFASPVVPGAKDESRDSLSPQSIIADVVKP